MQNLELDEQPNNVPLEVVVSVKMTTYNHEKYIAQAIQSVLMQKTDFPFELLIGEDASTDGTREICLDFARRYPSMIRLFLRDGKNKIHLNGRPTGKANSLALSGCCRGKYCAVLEGDDFWIDVEKLQLQYNFLESNPQYQMCGAVALYLRADLCGRKSHPMPKEQWGGFIPAPVVYHQIARVHTSTYFYRNGFRSRVPAWGRKVPQGDAVFLFFSCGEQGGIPYIERIVSIYRYTGTGMYSGRDSVFLAKSKFEFWSQLQSSNVGTSLHRVAFQMKKVRELQLRALSEKRNSIRILVKILLHLIFKYLDLKRSFVRWRYLRTRG